MIFECSRTWTLWTLILWTTCYRNLFLNERKNHIREVMLMKSTSTTLHISVPSVTLACFGQVKEYGNYNGAMWGSSDKRDHSLKAKGMLRTYIFVLFHNCLYSFFYAAHISTEGPYTVLFQIFPPDLIRLKSPQEISRPPTMADGQATSPDIYTPTYKWFRTSKEYTQTYVTEWT